ncbi:SusC/RagA family TonB-linked outer membrane protein [Bacteroides finegoldii]|jgi:TonB-linked SusC/RagA family outer membrane protein|uniref:SusC/RagA family TonB-linked outer membrane protein n=1 Tax=Bacteroides finegoldii TaxID=338188 RepID=UPI001897FEA5|nr:TonB-dependent receptor [Bacteroides finegoldii]MDC7139205.1 TonB-dependent receptor [Bacteroides finegoldii]
MKPLKSRIQRDASRIKFSQICIFMFFFLFPSSVYSQSQKQITGNVQDIQGNPLIGVSILETGTSNGTITDMNGTYSLNVSSTGATLKFSYIGYEEQLIKIQGRNIINVKMNEETSNLDEVVVVGYGVQRKSDLTGAISSINADEALKKMPTAQVADLLQGRIAGLSIVNSSGAAGATATLRVRGINSIKADGGPLVVIDGFPGGNLSAINPADIKSIEVLKDASSTAIYGSRGANGVILITTKSPKEGKLSVDYNGYIVAGTPADKPSIMPVNEFARMANDWNQAYYGKDLYSERQITNFTNGYDTYDYMGNIINDYAISHSHDISIKGGNEKLSFLFSTQYIHNKGIAGHSTNDRWNYRLKVDANITKKLKFGANFYGMVNSAAGNNFSGQYSLLTLAQQFPQTVLPYDKEGNLTQGTIDNTGIYNPIGFIDEQKKNNNEDMTFNNWLQAYISYEIIPGLTFRNEQQINIGNRFYGITNSKQSMNGFLKGKSLATYYDANSWGWRMTNTLNYTKELNKNNRINTTIGVEESISRSYIMKQIAEGLTSESIGWKNMMLAETSKLDNNTISKTTAISYFGRINYVLMNRYMATVTFRRDGSSLLSYDNRWDNFPSFSLAWNLKEEPFLRNVNFLDQLKLRYGYGVSGNQAVAAYSAYTQYDATIGNGQTAYTLVPGNPILKWEKTHQHNYGIDAAFLNGRISFTFDYYDKKTKDAINTVVLPADTGLSSGLRNAAEISNKGFEVTLGVTPLTTKDFYWKTDISLAHNKAKIEKLGDIDSDFMEIGTGWGNPFYRYFAGEPIGAIYGLQSTGVWSTEEYNNPDIKKPTSPTVRPGSYKYVDQDDSGTIDADDYVIIGNGQPKFNWGMNNSFTYKNFDLNIFLIGFHGFDIYNYPRARLTSSLSPFPELAERWIAGKNENAVIAGFGKDRDAITSPETVASSTFVEKGDFVKLKSITLGYNFSKDLLSKINLSAARIYFSIKNVCTITKYSGNDPELSISNPLRPGLDMGTYPSQREYLLGLNVSF